MPSPLYSQIYTVVAAIPRGRVATYGQIAAIVGRCGARQVGYAMSNAPEGLPWQRVINAQGRISVRADGLESPRQRILLEMEGVRFDATGRCDLDACRWEGPDINWLEQQGIGRAPLGAG